MSAKPKQYRILFVDDNRADIQLVSSVLSDEDYKVIAESDSKMVMDKLKNRKFDLILLDVVMPDIDGFALCKKIKQDSRLAVIPVIFVTSKVDINSVIQGFKIGAVDYITKPFNKHELLMRVRTHIELKKSRENLEFELEERRKTERKNIFLAQIVKATEDMAVIKDLDLKVITANEAWFKATGKFMEEVVGKTDSEIFENEFAEGFMKDEQSAQQLKKGEFVFREEKFKYPDGKIGIISTKKYPVFDENDNLIATANISRDITKEKENEEKLKELNKQLEKRVEERTLELQKESETLKKTDKAYKESQLRFEHLYNNVSMGLYRISTNGSFIMANPALVYLLGFHKFEQLKKHNLFLDFFQSKKVLDNFMGKIQDDGEVSGFGAKWINKNGTKLYLRISARPFFIDNDKLSYYEGSVEDITKAKIAEEELKLREKQYRLLFDNMTNGFILQEMLVDQNDEIIDYYYLEMNKALQDMMGDYYKPYKFIGRTMKEVPLNIDTDWFDKCKKVAIYGEQFHFEKYLPELGKHFEMLLYQPQYGQIATIINDITGRKESEEKINQQYIKIKKQNAIIESKNLSITDSINCAQRIQISMLPKLKYIKKYLPETFIFFRPKDIVSGDFYWFEVVEEKIILAVVDCTGHGVPGGYMSMVGNDMLNLIINVQGITEPDIILKEMHVKIRQSLARKSNEILDGMDVGICVIDKGTGIMEYAGAKIPLLCIQNKKMEKIRGDHVSIAVMKMPDDFRYQKHRITLNSPTTIYLYSDGYQDQFGGGERKKFLPQRFEDLIFSNHNELFEDQKKALKTTLEEWMGDFEQLDDILVIGSKIC